MASVKLQRVSAISTKIGVGLVFPGYIKLPAEGIPVPKHVGVWYLIWIVFYDLYLIECTYLLIGDL